MTSATAIVLMGCILTGASSRQKYADFVDKNVAAVRSKLGLDKIAAPKPGLRLWAGLDVPMVFPEDWSIVTEDVDPLMPYGMSRTYLLKRKRKADRARGSATRGSATRGRAPGVVIRTFVGVSAEAAREMILRRMATSSLPIDGVTAFLSLSLDGPGDVAIIQGNVNGKTKQAIAFVRDNIGVLLRTHGPVELGMDGILDRIDEGILKSKRIKRSDYERMLPVLSIRDVHPPQPMKGRKFDVRLMPIGVVRNCAVIGVLEHGAKGTYDAKRGIVAFAMAPGFRGTNRYGIAIYDRTSLLSRWTTGEVLVEAPAAASQPAGGGTPGR